MSRPLDVWGECLFPPFFSFDSISRKSCLCFLPLIFGFFFNLSIIDHISFLKLHNHIHPRAITEFSYRYRSNEKAFIYLSFLLGSSPSPSTATPSANETPKTNGSLKAPSAGPASTSTSQSQPIPPPTSSETPPPPVAPHRSDELDHLLQNLEKDGMPAMDISDNEFAKSHARYLVGGRAEVTDERVFRFGQYFRR